MGMYFNPENENFRKDSISEIYVDKTMLISKTNRIIGTSSNCIALSHARRFGKSQAADMLEAYYSRGCDSKELFSKFEIAKAPGFEEYLNKYNVIHLDIASVSDFHKDDLVAEIGKRLKRDFFEEYHNEIDYDNDIYILLYDIYRKSKIPFVIIIDEWDCVVRNHADRPDLVHEYLQFLHSLFKSEESKRFLALGYITGILPVKKIENESALNNFIEFTMIDSMNLTPYFGFTESEVIALCERFDMDFEPVKEWYDGYHISGEHMYNPNSVYQAMTFGKLKSYWKNTSSYDTINDLISLNFDGLKDDVIKLTAGEKVSVDVNTFRNDLTEINSKDDALTALIHLGYLGYEEETEEAYLPNYEVGLAFEAALSNAVWKDVAESIRKSNELLRATIAKDEEKVSEYLELAHEAYTSILKYNDENSLSCTVTMAYYTARAYYNVIRELPSGKGFADLVFLPKKNSGTRPAMIVELKYDKGADTAIKQIKEKRYTGALKDYEKEILLVGISYDKDTKRHECVIEEWV